MEKILITYFTNTGNTEEIAKAFQAALDGKAEVALADIASDPDPLHYDKFMFGSPAQGSEEVDETTFHPYIQKHMPFLKGKKVALFGSFGWGGGQYLVDFAHELKDGEVDVFKEPFTVLEAPDADALEEAKKFAEEFLAY